MDRDPRLLAGELVTCLKRQAESLQQFLELLARQQAALLARQSDEVDRTTRELEVVVTQSQRLESARKSLTARLVAGLKERPHTTALSDETSLADLTLLIAASEASELAAVQLQLRNLHREIERRRRLNAYLIEASLRCAGENLQWVARASGPKATYTPPGERPSKPVQLAVNRRC